MVAGVVYDTNGRILIAQRPPGKQLAGGWEFPGGKLEPGEARRDGLARELKEELGIVIGVARPLLRVTHLYAHGALLLDAWAVRQYIGIPASLDGQALRWCESGELAAVPLLPADAPVVAALCLPEVLTQQAGAGYEIVEADQPGAGNTKSLRGARCESIEAGIASATAGASFLVLAADESDDRVRALCEAVAVPVFIKGVSLERAWAMGASGIHRL